MKKVIIAIIALVGVGGLAALLSYKPQAAKISTKPTASPAHTSTASATPGSTTYHDGTYAGETVSTIYGPVQVSAVISGGKLTDVTWQQTPNDRDRSKDISDQADPQLTQEAIAIQSASVDVVSGATQTSEGFTKSLSTALTKAQS